jgi:nucleotide-binding universal stress UspA family protein
MRVRVLIGVLIVAAIVLFSLPRTRVPGMTRGVQLLHEEDAPVPRAFDPRQSAALFVGVRKFTRDENILEVPYAADDAVDLAYKFALDRRILLVSPSRVVVALSGRPQKEESKRRLEALEQAGATVEKAGPSDILMLLQRQAALAGRDGLLIVSIATHGYVGRDGVPYILGSTSLFQYPETALPTPKLFDIAAASAARRSLFFIDACRERISEGARAGASAATAAPLITRMGHINGQVVFYAAAAGGYAYDDDGNGVFTKAVIEGLSCKAAFVRGAVTVDTLRTFVERSVRTWIRQHRDGTVTTATQISMDGDSKNMPLCLCVGPPPPSPPCDVARATHDGANVTAFGSDGARLWSRVVSGSVSRVEVADLRNDGNHEVIVATTTSIDVFDRTGANVWSANESGELETFVVAHLLRHDPTLQITAVWNGDRGSHVSTYDAGGAQLSTYTLHGRLQHVKIDRPTSRHNFRIIATGTDDDDGAILGIPKTLATVLVLDSKGKQLWKGVLLPAAERIARFEVVSRDKYSREIILLTRDGHEVHLDFEGNLSAESSHGLTLKILPRHARAS